jgi:nitroreductase
MDAFEALAKRRSVRKYKPGTVTCEQLSQIVNMGRLAPTGRNEQPWEFVVVTDRAKLRRLAHLADNGKFIVDACACIVVLCRPATYYIEDGSAATTQIMVAATALGLASCWVAGDKKVYAPDVVAACGAPSEFKLVSLIAIGYPAEVPDPPKRKLSDVLHWETYRQ